MGTQARPSYEQRQRLGRRGEELAAAHLDSLGMVVLSTNWRCREGELDLVATDGRTLIVCEVKTRSGAGYGHPAEAVTPEKTARIRRLTSRWLEHYRVRWCPLRFDVIAIHWPPSGEPQLTHLPGAF
ncbi:YraN family protein [Amycolatopsis lurida]